MLPQQSNMSQHQLLEEDETISSQQTLDTNYSSLVEDDDLVNVDEGDVPYTFDFDPFSPFNSSFFVPSISSSFSHHHHPQVNSNPCSCCSPESESESEFDCSDSTIYPDCLYGRGDEYDQMDFINDLFDSRGEIEHAFVRFSRTDVGISVSEGSAMDDHDDDFDGFVRSDVGISVSEGSAMDDHDDDFVRSDVGISVSEGSAMDDDFVKSDVGISVSEGSAMDDRDDDFDDFVRSDVGISVSEGSAMDDHDDDFDDFVRSGVGIGVSEGSAMDDHDDDFDDFVRSYVGISVSEGSAMDDHDDDYDDFVRNNVGISVSEGSAMDDHDDDFVYNDIEELGLGFEGGGLSVVRIESDSDTEEPGQVDIQSDERIRSSDLNMEYFWDCPSFDSDSREEREESTARVDERDELREMIDRIEEISILSENSSEGDAVVRVLGWDSPLAANNLEIDLQFETADGGEGFVDTPEFVNTLIGHFVETVRALRGSPPAAKSIIDNLPLVALEESANEGDHVNCAVCKDEILLEEKVTRLPCGHHYHGECIVPWLSIRNTCPVCRFELPTDDLDYERSKNGVNDQELPVGYGLELSP